MKKKRKKEILSKEMENVKKKKLEIQEKKFVNLKTKTKPQRWVQQQNGKDRAESDMKIDKEKFSIQKNRERKG